MSFPFLQTTINKDHILSYLKETYQYIQNRKEDKFQLVKSTVKIYGARTKTLTMPRLLAANIVGLSLFQHTALTKSDLPSSSLSSTFSVPNRCHVSGFDIA